LNVSLVPAHSDYRGFGWGLWRLLGSMYAVLESLFGLVAAEADETIEATIADEAEAALLAVHPSEPLLLMKRTVQSQQHQVFEYAKVLYRADRFQYSLHLRHE
jgi:GntR family transcriptional regulator